MRRVFRFLMQRLVRTAQALAFAEPLSELAFREAQSSRTNYLPFPKRFSLWRRGFLTESHFLYQLDRNDTSEYISDVAIRLKTPRIDGDFAIVLDDKFLFHRVVAAVAPELLPRLYGLVLPPESLVTFDPPQTTSARAWLAEKVRRGERVVVRPLRAGGGKDVDVLTDLRDVQELAFRRTYLLTEFISQAPYAAAVYAETTNTIRIQTMWDVDRNRPFIAAAIHRFGTSKSRPVDNWSLGGLSAWIGEDGTVSAGVPHPSGGRLVWHKIHPDTGAAIEGLVVPRWDEICAAVLDLASRLPFLPYVGWDIIPTADSLKVIEGNSFTDLGVFQVHRPLLHDERIAKFFRHHGIVR